MSRMNPESMYADVISCEDRSAELYLDLSIHFCDQIDISWFWIEMAMEEKQQAGLLHYCLENRVFAHNLPDAAKMRNLIRLLDHLRTRTSAPVLSLDDAFDVAIRIESDICKTLLEPISAPHYVVEKKRALISGPHLNKLKIAAERFPASPAVRTRLAAFI
jgi:hypothetical protein